ncbi:MAG: 4Fe-4S binding protein, partial [Dehalococcoidales bacterium]
CPTGALYKNDDGPVLYDETRCIGCQYCGTACPFSIPHFDWEKKMVNKCTMCVDRIQNGLEPACIKTCPTGALSFSEREAVITVATLAESNGTYVYGKDEVGGTSWIYLSDVPFPDGGFPGVGTSSYPSISGGILASQMATIAVGAAALGFYSLYLRKKKLEEGE